VLGQEMALAKVARASAEWTQYEHARDTAIQLLLSHRIEDEIRRYRQVMTATTGLQSWGEEARERIHKFLNEAFFEAIDRGQSAHDLIVVMQRIPRRAAAGAMVQELRGGEGESCIEYLLCVEGKLAEDVRAKFGDDTTRIAKRLTDRDWAGFATALMTIPPGEPRSEVTETARQTLRRTLADVASRR
jgi:hypothetical protein